MKTIKDNEESKQKEPSPMLQLTIIVTILAVSYGMEIGLGLPIPASIIGMILLLILLLTKIIKISQVNKISELLQKDITLFLLPLSIGIIESKELFEGKFLITIIIVVISTVVSIFTTTLIMKWILNKKYYNECFKQFCQLGQWVHMGRRNAYTYRWFRYLLFSKVRVFSIH